MMHDLSREGRKVVGGGRDGGLERWRRRRRGWNEPL